MALDPVVVKDALDAAALRPATLNFFLENLNSPEWIEPLRERGLFTEPPSQLIDNDGLVRAPGWAQSRYLARVAAADPEAVLRTIASIETNNERVAEDFADAALAMPVETATKMTSLLARFVDRQHLYYLLPRKLAELIVRFATEGTSEAAVPLLRALFKPEATQNEDYWRPRTRPRFSDWEYDMLLRKIVSEALPPAPELFLTNLVKLLEESLRLIRANPEEPDSDGSRAWRVNIGDDSGRGIGVEESLTSALRDSAVAVRERELLGDQELLEILLQFTGGLYRRIAMYALARGREPDEDAARRFVLDTSELTRHEPSPEYRDLLRRVAPSLKQMEIAELLNVIDTGPDVDRYRELSEKYDGSAPSGEDVAQYIARWKIGRLELIAETLPDEARHEYEEFLSTYGPVELPLSFAITAFTGPNSPITVEELRAKGDGELVTYLRNWEQPLRAPGDEPSVEGLARAFAALSEADPERISRLAPQLQGLKPAYLQWMLEGIEHAVGHGTEFDWSCLLELLEWVVEQPREIEGGRGDDYSDLDPGWVWTRKAIASLLEQGLSASGTTRLRLEERERVWRIIEALAHDPEPTPEREAGDSMDPFTLALNTTRPRAVRAAIAYAIWVYQEMFGTDQPSGGGFFTEYAPEVARLLEERLQSEADPAASVRAVIGEFIANLFALDVDWVRNNAGNVFSGEETPLREAAWGAYVIYTKPYDNVFELLRPTYMRSAELAATPGHGFRWMNGDPVSALGEHLAAFYWRDVISLDDPVFATYWANAGAEARGNVVETLGRWAREVELVPEIIERLRQFWRFATKSVRTGEREVELGGFTWWFTAPGLPVGWRIDELQALLDQGVRTQADGMIAEELPSVAAEEPLKAIGALRSLIETEESWFPDAWHEQVERVLRIGHSSRDRETCELAYDTVNLLLAKGFQRFAVVLDEQGPTR